MTAGPDRAAAWTTAPPERTVAVVTGIERYAAGPAWELPGPARDAVRFRDWLLRAGVPEQNILLHLDPLPATPGIPPGLPYRSAGHDALRRTFVAELPALDGDLLLLWWGGHGVLDRDEHLRLFCADATVADKRNLDLESLRRLLSSDALPGFHRQLWLVDACQTFEELHGFHHSLPSETLPHGHRVQTHEQALLLAGSRGQRAANDPDRATGLFSDAVLHTLRSSDVPWPPPAPDTLLARVAERMAASPGAAAAAGQRPEIRFHRPGRSETVPAPRPVTGSAPHPGPGPHPGPRPGPGAGAVGALLHALLAYPLVYDPDERQAMVAELRTAAVERMPRHRVPRTDLLSIVRVLRQRGELWLLYDAMTLLDEDPERAAALAAAVRDCAGPRRHPAGPPVH
ncbi:effector-associated domain 2-containing protein [Streptomyces sp. YIM 98790]|uniref:effector-associated domain 2-containing protein n=1 Tax=Streptomyces sp. YIM 98790 TaxID=2689077 RepID=UPI00140E0B9D|nr:caspase family protein [Streptomyces sp. YIM 98790]